MKRQCACVLDRARFHTMNDHFGAMQSKLSQHCFEALMGKIKEMSTRHDYMIFHCFSADSSG